MPDLIVPMSQPAKLVFGMGLAVLLSCSAVIAQQQPPFDPKAAAATKAPPKAPAKSASPSSSSGTAESPARGTEAQLRQRVEQLEEQLVDMQVVIGTLESLAKNTGGGAAAPAGRGGAQAFGSGDQGRLDSMEMQIRALTAQLEQMGDQLRAAEGRRGATAPPPARTVSAPAAPPVPAFGATTVSKPDEPAPRGTSPDSQPGGSTRTSAVETPAGDGGSPKQLYETAYGFLLQQNYGAAEASFSDFLQRYPNDALAGNAQYWLGESFFVRGDYKVAASAFLKGYQTYQRSAKAPDSLLKLAMSLDRLGQREAACTSFNELNTRFPQAPSHVKSRADSERRRLGCA